MGALEFGILACWVVAACLYGAAFAMVGPTPADYRRARAFFVLAGVLFGATGIMWGLEAHSPTWVRLPVVGIVGAIALIGIVEGWRFLHERQSAAEAEKVIVEPKPLKRLIAYGPIQPMLMEHNPPKFQQYNIVFTNVGDDTITAKLAFLNVEIDGTALFKCNGLSLGIVQQTQARHFACADPRDKALIPVGTKSITVEFEIDYDTLPETGVRKSYRKVRYPLRWNPDVSTRVVIDPAQTIDEWEK